MDHDLVESMFRYYDERAGEYDEIYTAGGGPASISAPGAYTSEAAILAALVGQHCYGSLLDVPCGTGFWLPHYAPHCPRVTLLDQSPRMIAACRQRVESLGIQERCTFACVNIFEHRLAANAYDCALVGFFLSHLTTELEATFFCALEAALRPGGRFLVLDSIWSAERARTRCKEGRQARRLNDGRTFDIYKKYLEEGDIAALAAQYGFRPSVLHAGRVFIAFSGAFGL